ncbi:hypothetical protein [Dactylosporangium sp. CA-139066]|uniref:hypothetical protein n=1 Tax=Dactylosporangium sp. CA-139066 TaxID=3239930 RepID=UPI003D8E2888
MGLPDAEQIRDATCVACPAQALALGAFDVAERPGREHPYDSARGYRVHAATGTPTCVHPYRVGVPPAAYRSGGVPLPTGEQPAPPPPADPPLPDDPTLLEAWLIALVRTAPPATLGATLRRAEAAALERFAPDEILKALRRAFMA